LPAPVATSIDISAAGARQPVWKTMKTLIQLTVVVGVAVMVVPRLAVADDPLEEIVVTAQKRSERIQDVPIQVDVFTAQSIADAGIHDTSDFVGYIPNMTFDRADTYRNSFVVVRGLAQVTNADPPIAVIVDGVPQVDQKQFNMRLFDIEQIEVLKGPQGTLYGRDAIGGAVIVNTRSPTDHLSGYAGATVGNGDMVSTTAGLSGPLGSDRVLFRLSGDYLHDGGLIENTYLHDKSDFVHYDYSTRARLTFLASDTWTVDVRGQFGQFSGASNEYSWIRPASANTFVDPTYGFRPNARGDSTDAVIKVDGDLGFAKLTWINGYNRITEVNRADLDFSNPVQYPGGFLNLGFQVGQGQDLDDKIYSEEVRLTSKSNGPLRWVGGVSYQYSAKALQTRAFVDLDGSPSQIDNPNLVIVDNNVRNHYRSKGVFAQADYDFLPTLTLTGGLRYDRDEREQHDVVGDKFHNSTFLAWQPKLTLTYKPSRDQTFYLTGSSGYRPGGFNASPVAPTYKSEFVRNFEGGFKTTFLDGQLLLNGALFYENDHNYQYYYVDVRTASQIDQNIDRVGVKGAELETQWHPSASWLFFANFGYSDAKIKQLDALPQYIGNYTPNLTPWNAALGTEYRAPLVGDLKWYGRIDGQLYGRKYWQVDNMDVQNAKQYLNARAGIEGSNWGAYLWGKNITNTRAYSQYVSPSLGVGVAGIGFLVQPASYGLELRVSF
jgi:iron complex outermembrane receptor protein